MSVTEWETSCKNAWFNRPLNLMIISIYFTRTSTDASGVIIEKSKKIRRSWCDCITVICLAIVKWKCFIAMWIDCKYRIFTCVAAMELNDKIDVPVLLESLMAIYLQLVSLTIEVTLNHWSGMVNISCVLMPNIFNQNRGGIRFQFDFVEILIETEIKISIPIVPIVLLVVNDYAKFLRVFGCLQHRL